MDTRPRPNPLIDVQFEVFERPGYKVGNLVMSHRSSMTLVLWNTRVQDRNSGIQAEISSVDRGSLSHILGHKLFVKVGAQEIVDKFFLSLLLCATGLIFEDDVVIPSSVDVEGFWIE